ncbi:hypothetical protein [Arthrobacter sp. ZGTC412]|uniref:hypothetical protein n=1 Tax=Arthrobacter sp. ZGTC412 TaxID=2058900 RepID=UPI000CE2E507|nr:hypothetical protein [Arthrobacter sp. ZGTC412]
MGGQLTGAELQQDMLRASQVEQLAGRVAFCAGRGEEVLDGFRDIQLLEWESPAGRAYRDAVSLQSAALRRALEALTEAKAAVDRHARETFTADCTSTGGF